MRYQDDAHGQNVFGKLDFFPQHHFLQMGCQVQNSVPMGNKDKLLE